MMRRMTTSMTSSKQMPLARQPLSFCLSGVGVAPDHVDGNTFIFCFLFMFVLEAGDNSLFWK